MGKGKFPHEEQNHPYKADKNCNYIYPLEFSFIYERFKNQHINRRRVLKENCICCCGQFSCYNKKDKDAIMACEDRNAAIMLYETLSKKYEE